MLFRESGTPKKPKRRTKAESESEEEESEEESEGKEIEEEEEAQSDQEAVSMHTSPAAPSRLVDQIMSSQAANMIKFYCCCLAQWSPLLLTGASFLAFRAPE